MQISRGTVEQYGKDPALGAFLDEHNGGPSRLREMMAERHTILAPGAYDALSARLIEAAGFPAVYMTGFGVAASMLGRPDVGLTTMNEMLDSARRIVQAVTVPVIADADTGYGNALTRCGPSANTRQPESRPSNWRIKSHRSAAATWKAST